MEIPYQQLSADALRGIIEEFVSREGTDYGGGEHSFEQKVAQVEAQLRNGRAVIVFNPEDESCSIIPRKQRS